MKQETATPADRLRVLLKMYALALLLAMFICAFHAGQTFGGNRRTCWMVSEGKGDPLAISNPRQVFPLAKVTAETQFLRYRERCSAILSVI